MSSEMPAQSVTLLRLDQADSGPLGVDLSMGSIAGLSLRCPDKEGPNEDCAFAASYGSDSLVLAVADGAGGLPAGHKASGAAIQALADSLQQSAADALLLRTAVLNGIEAAQTAVLSLSNGSATTLTIVALEQHHARCYHVGDSAALIVGQRGKLKLETIPHSPTGFAVEAGFLDASAALFHEHRHLVSNFIGDSEMRIEVGKTLVLARKDTVLVASDGLFDNLQQQEILNIIRSGPIAEAASQLAAMARQRMMKPEPTLPSKPDDLSLLLFRLA
ncbi:MAG: protein phosphatase 2C domain-containing protein [Gammaproteobacteria bacterium]|nr:protein phosphatase 2C domain-containing protein [Gammaproteobacteria bacterium]